MTETAPAQPRLPVPKKRRRGCWIALGVLALLVSATLYIIYFTAIPARLLLSRGDTFEAEGVSGSLASGHSAVNVFRFDTGAGSLSEIHGFEVKYPTFGPYDKGDFVIESLTVENAILYLDSQNLDGSKKKDDKKSSDSPKKIAGSRASMGSA